MDLDVATATATELAEAIRDRRISSRELLEYLIARGERLNPALNAVARLRAAGAIIVAGPMARGVGDLRTALGIVAGPLPQEAAGLAPRA
jgi:Asp-tRNA(Asn)/Glu-tRNA(Gln) amidotransferase A subunit family amidase